MGEHFRPHVIVSFAVITLLSAATIAARLRGHRNSKISRLRSTRWHGRARARGSDSATATGGRFTQDHPGQHASFTMSRFGIPATRSIGSRTTIRRCLRSLRTAARPRQTRGSGVAVCATTQWQGPA